MSPNTKYDVVIQKNFGIDHTISLDEFFKKLSSESIIKKEEVKEAFKGYITKYGFKTDCSDHLTRVIYLDLPEVQEKDSHLHELIQQDTALALRAFYEALRELRVDIRGFSIGFKGARV